MNTKIRFKTVLAFAVLAMAVIGLATTSANAATELTHDTTVTVYQGTNFNLSVYPGKAMYSAFDGNLTGTFGDGTVLDYRFFNGTKDVMTSYADGGAGIIAPVPSPSADNCNGQNQWASIWTTSDPNADFGAPANYISGTMALAQNFTGTIDISGLRSGTVYFIYGTYEDYNVVSLTMSGAGQPDLTAEHWENPPLANGNMGWISSFDFSNDSGDYDTITYTYLNNDFDASRARFTGVIIDGIGAFGPTNMSPENLSVIAPGDVVLSWTNLDPCAPPAPTYVDVLFGTEPNAEMMMPIVTGAAVETVTVPDPGLGTFYWQVNSYTNGSPTGDPILGPVLSFTNDAPISSVDLSDKVTWSGKGIQMAPAITDDGASGLTYLWTADLPIGVTVGFDPADNVENPIVTFTKIVDFTPYVVNGGFEEPVLADGAIANTGSVPGWKTMWTAVGSGTWLDDSSPDAGATNPEGDVTPEGENAGHSPTNPSYINALYQVLTDVVEANTTYELSVKVGNTSGAPTADYIVELVTGDMAAMGDGTSVIVASATGASPADETTWTTATAAYTSGADASADPGVGQPLMIRLSAAAFAAGSTVNFDDVMLSINGETGVTMYDPEMSTASLSLTVNDETNPAVTKTMTVDVYDTACKAANGTGSSSITDFNGDCVTSLGDLAQLAANWLNDTSYTEAMPKL